MASSDIHTLRVGLTGGIGAGKSVVARMLRLMGFPVYDCDDRARVMMDTDNTLRHDVVSLLGANAYATPESTLNRRWVASQAFNNPELLSRLNAIVHPHVRADLALWFARQQSPLAFAETALLMQAGMANDVDRIVAVVAPYEVRERRVALRNGLSSELFRQRTAAQHTDEPWPNGTIVITNDDRIAVLPQLLGAVADLIGQMQINTSY